MRHIRSAPIVLSAALGLPLQNVPAIETYSSAQFTESFITSNYTQPLMLKVKFWISNNKEINDSESFEGYIKLSRKDRVEKDGKTLLRVTNTILIADEPITFDSYFDEQMIPQFDEDLTQDELTVYSNQRMIPQYVTTNQLYHLNNYVILTRGPADKIIEEGANYFILRKIDLGFEACEETRSEAANAPLLGSYCYMFNEDTKALIGLKMQGSIASEGEVTHIMAVGFIE